MIKLILLRPYLDKQAGDTIEVADADAQAFIDAGRAKPASRVSAPAAATERPAAKPAVPKPAQAKGLRRKRAD